MEEEIETLLRILIGIILLILLLLISALIAVYMAFRRITHQITQVTLLSSQGVQELRNRLGGKWGVVRVLLYLLRR